MRMNSRLLLSTAALIAAVGAAAVSVAAQQRQPQSQDEALAAGGGPAAQANRREYVPPAPTGPVPRRADGKPDLTGYWDGSEGVLHNTVILEEHPGGFGVQAGKSLIIDPKDGKIPYQPWALAERDRRRDDANGYEDHVGHCEFYDIARVHQFAKDFMFSGNNFVMNETQHITRVVPVDRKEHLPSTMRLWHGDSIARWEGDTLVVDTTNLLGKTRMALGGDFYSANAHIVERFTMKDSNTIDWTLTIEDPTVFTRPWTLTTYTPLRRQREPQGAARYDAEDTCHEGNVDLLHLKNTYTQAHGPDAHPTTNPDKTITSGSR
jgi:hypothetical protein